jgi:hypothetical protein
MARQPKDWKPVFLEAFRQNGNVRLAAQLAGVGRTTVYDHKKDDPDFAKAFDEAAQDAADSLEAEARRRAIEGVNEPVVHQGKVSGVWVNHAGEQVTEGTPGAKLIPLTVKKYSDTLLIFLLKGRRPDVFGDKTTIMNHGDITLRNLSDGKAAADQILDQLRERLGVKPAGTAEAQ